MTTATDSGHGSRFTAEVVRLMTPPSAPSSSHTLGWNALNQLTSASRNGALQASFQYDPLGRRVVKSTPGKVTTYTYDGADILRENVTAGGITTTSYYVHGPSIDEPLGKETGGVMTHYHADGLGSIVKETSAVGAVTNTLRYDAWGNIEAGARDGFGFTGREYDSETGLLYYRARYLDPKSGRFISEDPISFSGGSNFYTYVSGNPIRLRDPLGLLGFSFSASGYDFLGGGLKVTVGSFGASVCFEVGLGFGGGFDLGFADKVDSPGVVVEVEGNLGPLKANIGAEANPYENSAYAGFGVGYTGREWRVTDPKNSSSCSADGPTAETQDKATDPAEQYGETGTQVGLKLQARLAVQVICLGSKR